MRENRGGKLYSMNYGAVIATAVDPIEKKPLYHFQPGSLSYSLAAVGCNFQCEFCQNWQISQWPRLEQKWPGHTVEPERVVREALATGCSSVAYTYTEPTIFMELAADIAGPAKEAGLANVFVSNGYMTREALDFAKDWLDAINVDLKSFREEFYREVCKARLGPVLDTLRYLAEETGIWLEVTTLVVPGQNDSDEELGAIARFIAEELGREVPWHISRFHGAYRMDGEAATPMERLEKAYELGKEAGLRFIYVGNVPGTGKESTYCHECGSVLIERRGFQVRANHVRAGACPVCGTVLVGRGL